MKYGKTGRATIDPLSPWSLGITQVSTNDAGAYRCRIVNDYGEAVSNEATLTVVTGGAPAVGVETASWTGYCNEDPMIPRIDYGEPGCIALENTDVRNYLAKELNAIAINNNIYEPQNARKAVWNSTNGNFNVTYSFWNLDNVAGAALGMNESLYAYGSVYFAQPAWAAYANRYTYDTVNVTPAFSYDATKFYGKMNEYEQDLIGRYTDVTGGRQKIAFWTLGMEQLRDDPTPITDFASLFKWYYEMPVNPADSWGSSTDKGNCYYRSCYHPLFAMSSHGKNRAYAANRMKDFYRQARTTNPDALLIYDDYGCDFRYQGPADSKQEQMKYRRARAMIDAFKTGACQPTAAPQSPAQANYTLRANCRAGSGSGYVTIQFGSQSAIVQPGEEAYLSVSANTTVHLTSSITDTAHWHFLRWEGSPVADVTDPSTTLTMDGNKDVTAFFIENTVNTSDEDLDTDPAPLDVFAPQMFIPAWWVMTYDPSYTLGLAGMTNTQNMSSNAAHLRLNVDQLRSVRESIKGLAEKGVQVIISQMSIRIGVPQNQVDQYENIVWPWYDHDYLWNHLTDPNFTTPTFVGAQVWAGLDQTPNMSTLDLRRQWQGRVYEAIINAALAVPQLRGIVLCQLEDEYSWITWDRDGDTWPYTPGYTDPGLPEHSPSPFPGYESASQPCIFGRNLETPFGNRETYYPKPAYYGVRNAMTNYFGRAFSVKNPAGEEVVRFVENGNVLVMKEHLSMDQTINEHCTTWIDNSAQFIVQDATGSRKAVVKQDGEIFLAGTVQEAQTVPIQAANDGTSFQIRNSQGTIVSMIDDQGNLKMTGHLYVEGLPWDLREYEDGHAYGTKTSDPYFAL